MASVKVRVEMSPDFNRILYSKPSVKGAVTKEANAIAGRANAMGTPSGVWHETQPKVRPHTPGRTGGVWHGNRKSTKTEGGTEARYEALPAKPYGDEGFPVSIVVTANHAAQKDNMKNNTLLKALG